MLHVLTQSARNRALHPWALSHVQGAGQWGQPGAHRLPTRKGPQILSRHAEVPYTEQLHVMMQGSRKWGCIHG